MSKQAEFAVILKMNPMFADLGADEDAELLLRDVHFGTEIGGECAEPSRQPNR